MKVATKPKNLVTRDKSVADVGQLETTGALVDDHKIGGLNLHHYVDATKHTFNGVLYIARPVAFEASFEIHDGHDKASVRTALIESAVYTDDGSRAAGHVAMNAKFKALIRYIMQVLSK